MRRHLALWRASPSRHRRDRRAAARPAASSSGSRRSPSSSARSHARAGRGTPIAAAYGRIAFYYILKALDLPPGSEIIFPSLTFWVVPELARVAGLTVVFADVDPATFTMDPAVGRAADHATRRARSCRRTCTACRATWIACSAIAARHNLIVLEDCAHALGATYKGTAGRHVRHRRALQLSDAEAAQLLRRRRWRSCRIRAVAAKVRAIVDALPWPSEKRVRDRLLMGRLQRIFIKPWVFSISLFPVLWVSALIDANPDVFLWEKIRSLHPLPDAVHRALSQRAGGDRPRGAEAPRRVDRAGAGQRAAREPRARRHCRAFRCRSCRPIERTSTISTACTARRTAARRARRPLRAPRHRRRDAARGRAARHGAVRRRTRRRPTARAARPRRCRFRSTSGSDAASRSIASATHRSATSLASVMLVYLPILLFAAILEGEIYYSTCARRDRPAS